MREFTDLESFIAFLEVLPIEVREAAPLGLEAGAVLIEHKAKGMLGTYQSGSGEFPAWEPLRQETQLKRDDWGYSVDQPELVTTDLRDHIQRIVDRSALEAAVGVPNLEVGDHDDPKGNPHTRYRNIGEVAAAQELGLHGLPQRSFLGLSCALFGGEVVDLMSYPVIAAICGMPTPALISPEAHEIPF